MEDDRPTPAEEYEEWCGKDPVWRQIANWVQAQAMKRLEPCGANVNAFPWGWLLRVAEPIDHGIKCKSGQCSARKGCFRKRMCLECGEDRQRIGDWLWTAHEGVASRAVKGWNAGRKANGLQMG